MSSQVNSPDMSSVTSSPGLQSGATLCASQDGPMTDPSGQAPAPASLSPRRAKEAGLLTSGTCGLTGSTTSNTRSREMSLSLASRLRQRTDLLGSTLFTLTWKQRATPSGRSIPALRASGRRTSGNDCTSWPTPNTPSGGPNVKSTATHTGGMDLDGAATLASWPTTTSNDTRCYSEESIQKYAKGEKVGGHNLDLNAAASLASWLTPMAGTPAQKGYNEAGNTDSSRKTVALVAGWPTPLSAPNSEASHNQVSGQWRAAMEKCLPASWPTTKRDDVVKSIRSHEGAMAEFERKGVNDLTVAANLASWVSPTACSPNSLRGSGQDPAKRKAGGHAVNLQDQVLLTATGTPPTGSPASTEKRGQLNPAHSRWLMGLPAEWDACAPTETASSLRKRRKSLLRT